LQIQKLFEINHKKSALSVRKKGSQSKFLLCLFESFAQDD
jgi:hypothetical protein